LSELEFVEPVDGDGEGDGVGLRLNDRLGVGELESLVEDEADGFQLRLSTEARKAIKKTSNSNIKSAFFLDISFSRKIETCEFFKLYSSLGYNSAFGK
jgi:hypothetical protein